MPTIKDVALEAGVSVATVSKVLNSSSYGSPAARKEVIRAAKRLHYHPSRIAKSMVKGKTGMIGLVIPDVRNPFFTSVARGVEDVANKYDYGVMFCNTDENPHKQSNYVDVLMSKVVDGFIIAVTSSEDDKDLRKINEKELPFVFIDRGCPSLSVDSVMLDNHDGAYKAVDHLISLGHKKIGIIFDNREIITGRRRLDGYIDAFKDNGIETDGSLIKGGQGTKEDGYNATKEIIALEDKPTAIFAANNPMMLGCLKALHELGVSVPQEVALVGFDDMDWAECFRPPLSVVRQPTYTMGTLAGEILFQRIEGSSSSERQDVVLKPELVVRESSGKLI